MWIQQLQLFPNTLDQLRHKRGSQAVEHEIVSLEFSIFATARVRSRAGLRTCTTYRTLYLLKANSVSYTPANALRLDRH